MLAEGWSKMTPDERYAQRMQIWLDAEGMEFASPAARDAYRERVTILRDSIELKKPERVLVAPWVALFPALWDGMTPKEAYYDTARLSQAWARFHAEFDSDIIAFPSTVPCAVFDILDYKLCNWPGHNISDEASFQYVEKEWMTADEYDALSADPSGYFQRTYLPRLLGALSPWENLAPFADFVEAPTAGPFFAPYGLPPVQKALEDLAAAGRVALEWLMAMGAMNQAAVSTHGRIPFAGALSKAPYDIIGDTLRGARGLMLDTFRRPEKVIKACESLVPIAVDMGRRGANATKHPLVFLPLHKGADGFLSDADFRRFYWPTLKAVLLGLIDEGIVPLCFAEGGYNDRLEVIHDPDIPPGRVVWMFDTTDMRKAKSVLGDQCCIGGNVPGDLLTTGTSAEVDAYVKELIEDVGTDGGFILGSGIMIDNALPECLGALIEAGKRYG